MGSRFPEENAFHVSFFLFLMMNLIVRIDRRHSRSEGLSSEPALPL